jgi:hypothetical protein
MFCIFSSIICLWVIYFNGAERLENSILGYFEFGQIVEKSAYIKVAAWLGLILSIGFLISDLSA